MTRVAVTGIGCVNALGTTVDQFWQRLCNGENGIQQIFAWDVSNYPIKIAGRVDELKIGEYFGKQKTCKLDRVHQLSIVAAKNALTDAGLDKYDIDKQSSGIFIGTSLGGIISGQKYHHNLINDRCISVRDIYNYRMNSVLDYLSTMTGFLGCRSLISTACTASTIAIAHAIESIKLGTANVILAGGVDPLCELSFAGFSSMKNVSTEACAPFSTPIGLTLGEGAGMIILENFDHAVARKAKIYAEVSGYALSADAYHPTSPDVTANGQKNLIIKLLENSVLKAQDVDYINAHGTGTAGNDAIEAKGIRLALGDHLEKITVSSSKGAIGHTLGAAGAIEAIITILTVFHDQISPTANFKNLRIGCELPHITKTQSKEVVAAITQNFAFGGNNAALSFCKPTLKRNFSANSKQRRVVITGTGLVTPIGSGNDNFYYGVTNNKSGVLNDISYPEFGKRWTAAIIPDFSPKMYSRFDFRRVDRIGAFTICAIEMAIKHAGLSNVKKYTEMMGIVVGTDCGPIESTLQFNEAIARGQPRQANPILFPNTVLNAGCGLASIYFKLKGPNIALNVGEASGLNAISYAFDLIRTNNVDRMVAGGVDEIIPFKLNAYQHLIDSKHSLKQDHNLISTPFDLRRSNMVLGEGAAFFVLEDLESALNRGANILCEILGHSSCADSPIIRGWDTSGDGVLRCMSQAFNNAGINYHDVDFVASGALSDSIHDQIEATAINRLCSPKIPVSAFSSMVGVSAATAPMSIAATISGMQNNFIPAQVNYEIPDPKCKLNIITTPQSMDLNTAIINAFSHGGYNTSLVIKKFCKDKM